MKICQQHSALPATTVGLAATRHRRLKTVGRCVYGPLQSADIYLSEWSLLQLLLQVSCQSKSQTSHQV